MTASGDDTTAIQLTVDGSIAWMTLNRPDRMNALDGAAWQLLRRRIADVASADEIRVLVVRGAGGNFCAGADVQAARSGAHPLQRMRMITDAVRELFELPIPTIAAVEGVAVGAGWNIALACDFVLSTDTARFSQIFARRGLSVDCGGSWLLPRIVGMQQAKRLLYLAEMLSAQEALSLGLVLSASPADELDAAVADLAGRLALAPPAAVRLDKELINSTWTTSFPDQLLRENAAQAINFATDAPIARAAIAQKETPVFEGKWQL